jgi:hypothetical protein
MVICLPLVERMTMIPSVSNKTKRIFLISTIVVISGTVFTVHARGTTMKFEVSTSQGPFSFQEPLTLTFRLTAVDKSCKVPLEYKRTDAIAVSLFDANRKLLERSTGYDVTMKIQGGRPRSVPQKNLQKVELPKGKTLEWRDNLLRFVEIPSPGTYYIGAEFMFEPSGIKLQSEQSTLVIKPSQAVFTDAIVDYICVSQLFLLQTNVANALNRTFLHFSGSEIFPASESIVLPPTIAFGTVLAKADFTESANFDQDMIRWYAAVSGKSLFTGYVDANTETEKTFEAIKDLPDKTSIFGRPIQHHDKSVTVFLKNGEIIEALRVGADGTVQKKAVIATDVHEASPSCASASSEGVTSLVFGTNGSLPVKLIEIHPDGTTKKSDVLSEKQVFGTFTTKPATLNASILSISPLLGVLESPDNAIVIMLRISDAQTSLIRVIKVPWNQEASAGNTVEIISPVLDPEAIQTSETIVYGRTLLLPGEKPFCVIVTNKGKVFLSIAGPFKKCVAIDPARASAVTLVRSTTGDVYLLYPEKDKGLSKLRVYAVPRVN